MYVLMTYVQNPLPIYIPSVFCKEKEHTSIINIYIIIQSRHSPSIKQFAYDKIRVQLPK